MNRIRDLREDRDMLQKELAVLLQCSATAVCKYENESRALDPVLINRLCDIFGVTADYLLCRSSVPTLGISDEDAALLRAYHAADDRARSMVALALEPFAEQGEARRAQSTAG